MPQFFPSGRCRGGFGVGNASVLRHIRIHVQHQRHLAVDDLHGGMTPLQALLRFLAHEDVVKGSVMLGDGRAQGVQGLPCLRLRGSLAGHHDTARGLAEDYAKLVCAHRSADTPVRFSAGGRGGGCHRFGSLHAGRSARTPLCRRHQASLQVLGRGQRVLLGLAQARATTEAQGFEFGVEPWSHDLLGVVLAHHAQLLHQMRRRLLGRGRWQAERGQMPLQFRGTLSLGRASRFLASRGGDGSAKRSRCRLLG